MSEVLAPLRRNLDAMPSPDPEHPGLLLRDSFGYSERVLVIPPQLVPALQFFDGASSTNDLREWLVRVTNSFDVGDQLQQLVAALSESGFLENETYFELRDNAHKQFAEMPVRPPAFAGAAYPECPEDCRRYFDQFLEDAPTLAPSPGRLVGIAAPHVSYEGGWECYRDAFTALREMGPERTYIVLATSHYGEPEKFGITRKPFLTPYGQTTPALDLLDEIQALAPDALIAEDFCHVMEHSAEFHVLWLQHLFGPEVKVLPILVGSCFADSPDANPHLAAMLHALRTIAEKHGDQLGWVLSIDMAHMGPRYGDERSYDEGDAGIERNDQRRIETLTQGDIDAFWTDVRKDDDPWKWCGSAPLYTFYRALPGVRAELLRYSHWDIDEASVVSFAGMRFHQG
ncbi:AmmeMemoRadiSam system protein B [Bryobacter aggregatus]|uniref:AmmeMemoRadiSam system protein B n=1 Tax=Bryobacter aggregatus TaxID=360054 RepID=UPI0004E266A4|nr:AmmeMemoRadiSam system protein B [Bryobacter aggregatus]